MKFEDETIKNFELDARRARLTMDRLNKAYYGMTFDEAIKLLTAGNKQNDVSTSDRGTATE